MASAISIVPIVLLLAMLQKKNWHKKLYNLFSLNQSSHFAFVLFSSTEGLFARGKNKVEVRALCFFSFLHFFNIHPAITINQINDLPHPVAQLSLSDNGVCHRTTRGRTNKVLFPQNTLLVSSKLQHSDFWSRELCFAIYTATGDLSHCFSELMQTLSDWSILHVVCSTAAFYQHLTDHLPVSFDIPLFWYWRRKK